MLKTDVPDAHWRISFLDENLTGMLQPRSPLYRRQFALGLYFGGILHFQSTYIDQASAWHALVAAYFRTHRARYSSGTKNSDVNSFSSIKCGWWTINTQVQAASFKTLCHLPANGLGSQSKRVNRTRQLVELCEPSRTHLRCVSLLIHYTQRRD